MGDHSASLTQALDKKHMTDNGQHKLWITYAWVDNEGGDFTFLVQELEAIRVHTQFDKISLVPGRRLWDQIATHITKGSVNGWAYLITPSSLESEACREELAYALDRALNTKGDTFPLIGLLHGVRIEDIPPALKVRLCVSLASPTWKEEIRAGLEGRPPNVKVEKKSKHVWAIHEKYNGNTNHTCIEVRPRFGEIMYWRFIVPRLSSLVHWGCGPAGAKSLNKRNNVIEGHTDLNGVSFSLVGSGDRLSPSISAGVVIEGQLPDMIGFGESLSEYGAPEQYEMCSFKKEV